MSTTIARIGRDASRAASRPVVVLPTSPEVPEVSLALGLALASAVGRSSDRVEALRAIAQIVAEELDVPAAAWVKVGSGSSLRLVDARGGLDARSHERFLSVDGSGDLARGHCTVAESIARLLVSLTGMPTTVLDVTYGVVVFAARCPDAERSAAELADILAALPAPAGSTDAATSPVMSLEGLKFAALSPRERQVLALIAEGTSTRLVAEHLSISAKTVKTHVQNILGKLGVASRLEAVAFVARNGFQLTVAS